MNVVNGHYFQEKIRPTIGQGDLTINYNPNTIR